MQENEYIKQIMQGLTDDRNRKIQKRNQCKDVRDVQLI